MAKVAPFHSKKNPGKYHECSNCTEGNNIEKENRAAGDRRRNSLLQLQRLDQEQ
jgi:hypothetical protein